MKIRLSTMTAATILTGLCASASQETIGGKYTIDTDLTVKSLTDASGSFAVHGHDYDDLFALNYNWGSSNDTDLFGQGQERLSFNSAPTAAGPGSSILAGFLNPVTNNAGIDVIFFESGDSPTKDKPNLPEAQWLDPIANLEIELLSASVDGTASSWADMVVLDFLTGDAVGDNGATSFGVYVYGLDLSTLGIGDGDTVSQLYIGNTVGSADQDPDVVYAAGVAATAIPTPGAAVMGLVALGGLAMRRRRRAA